MKKLTAIVLTLTMLLSMLVLPMGVTATEITEAERQELLSAPYYQYVDLSSSANADLFASFEEAGTYARFNKSASGTSSAKDATYTFTEEVEGESKEVTIYDWLPISTDIAYSDVTFYKKGFKPTDKAPVDGTYMIEDLLLENGSKVTTTQYTGGNNSSPLTAYNGTYTHTKVVTRTVNNSHVMDVVTENDATYAVIKNAGIQHKIGPLSRDAYSPNAVYLSTSAKAVPVNMSGNKLSVLFMLGNLHANNYTASYTGIGAGPLISIQKVSLYYEGDSTAHDKYVFVEHNTEGDYNANYLTKKPFVSRAVVYAPKNEDGTALTKDDFYNSDASLRKTFKYVTADNAAEHGIDVTTFNPNEGIQFPNDKYIVAERATVAAIYKQRQGILENDYGDSANLINIPLENKVLEKVSYKTDYTLKNYEGAWWIGTSDTARQGIIPIEIPSANQDYEYFIYTGSVANTSSVVGMTVVGESLQDKIDALNTVLSALDSAALTEEDVASYRAQIAELKAESEYILDTDFDTSKLDAAEERIEEEKAQERAEEIVNASNVTQFPLSAATGANSRLFVKKGTESEIAESGYLEGIDFFGRLADSAAAEADKYIAYSMESETPAAKLIFKQDEGGKYIEITHFEEETKKYYVNPDEKVIKIMKVDATEQYYGENAAAAASLNGCTIDVPDGKYNSIGLLAGAGWLRPVTTTLIYEDGEVEVPSEDAPYIYYWSHENFRGAEGTDKYNYYIANWNYTTASQRGTFIYNNLADFSETTTRIGYKEYTVVSDPSRVLKAVKFASGNTGSPVSIISLWGNKATVAEKLAELEGLTVTDEASLETAKAAIADFDAYLADLGYTLADLASYKTPYTDLKAEIAEYELKLEEEVINSTDDRVWFDLNGNSKFFVKQDSATKYIIGETTYTATNFTDFRTNFKDYLPGVDFAGFVEAPTGDFATDQTEVYPAGYGGFMFLYTVDKNTKGSQYATPDFTTGDDGNLYWSINGDKYRVDPKENVIKVTKNAVDVSALADADTIARYESVNKEAVIDVADGRYKNVGLLTGLNADYNRTMAVTLVYEDETEVKAVKVTTGKISSDTSYLTGHFYLQNFTNTGAGGSNSNGGHGFVPVTIETDPTKTLTAIKIMDGTTTSTARCFYVVSAWGVAVPEISNASYADGKVTVDYSAVATTKGKVLVVEYSQDEKEFKKITVVPALFTKNNTKLEYYVKTGVGNKVKVFVWRDLIDFFPYK